MLESIKISQIYVLDQDEALAFYVGKLGLEVHTDADLGFMRWLTINVPGDKDREILLETPGRPAMDEATASQVRELVTKGASGGHLFFTTTERPYGIDCGLRDPFGNHIRFSQPIAAPAAAR